MSHVGTSESKTVFSTGAQGDMSPTQPAASLLRSVTTSATFGLSFESPSQQRWTKLHNKSENPMDEAFSGLAGRNP